VSRSASVRQQQPPTSGTPHSRRVPLDTGSPAVVTPTGYRLHSAETEVCEAEVIAPNFKMRLSGVTSTIVQLVPLMRKLGLGVAALGPGLPKSLPRIRFWRWPSLLRRPAGRPYRVWHARRNTEMLGGLILRHVLRAPLKLLFTSASQRRHKPFTKWLIRRMDAVVATSRKTAAYLEVPNTVIMHGIDTARFCPVSDQAAAKRALGLDPAMNIVGCIGRIRHQKGTDLFVDTMIRLLPERPGWMAIIAGRTTAEHREFETELRERIAAAGLSDRIRFVGEHTSIEQWYQVLSLLVAPQRWEGFGLTPLEAMACRVPVVASDVGAFSELIVDGKTGAVIEPDSLESMITATAVYFDDTSLRKATGQAAAEHVRDNFPLQREAESLIAVYRQLMSKNAA
jgi:mannosyltransferase